MELLWSILSWIVFGLIVGAIARFLIPGRDPMGWGMTIALGILGSFLGGLVMWLLFREPGQPFSPASWIGAIIGAIVVVLLYRYSQERTTVYR